MSYFAIFVLFAVIASAFAVRPLPATIRNAPATVFEKCVDVPVLGNCCGEIYVFPNNLTVGAELTVGDMVLFNQQLTASSICASDVQLLQLIDKIPALLPFKPLILALIALHKFIPGEVFSVCLDTHNLTVSSSRISGCSALDITLMCWKGDCLYRGNTSLGCFDVPLSDIASDAAVAQNEEVANRKPAPLRKPRNAMQAKMHGKMHPKMHGKMHGKMRPKMHPMHSKMHGKMHPKMNHEMRRDMNHRVHSTVHHDVHPKMHREMRPNMHREHRVHPKMHHRMPPQMHRETHPKLRHAERDVDMIEMHTNAHAKPNHKPRHTRRA